MQLTEDRKVSSLISVSDRTHGFATRVKNIVSAQRLAEDVSVYWEESAKFGYKELGYYFPELNEVDEYQNDLWRYEHWRFALLDGEVPEGFSNKDTVFNETKGRISPGAKASNRFHKDHLGSAIDFEYTRTPKPILDEYSKLFQELKISDHITDKVRAYKEANFDGSMVGVHMRTWYDCKWRKDTLYSFETTVELMSEHKGSKFFIATDDVSVLKPLRDIFGEENIVNYEPEPHCGFLVEMLLLSECDHIIGSLLSTYTELAWWLGGAKSSIKIVYPTNLRHLMDAEHRI